MSRAAEPVHLALGIRHQPVSLGHALGKVEGHLGVDQAPVLPPSGPLFRNIHHSQIQHFQQTVIGGKDGLGLGHLAQLAVESPQWRWWCRSACAPPGGT